MSSDRKHSTRYRLPRVDFEQKKPLRVLMISTVGELGGAERSFFELLRALPREHLAPEVCVPPDSTLSRLCLLCEVPVHPVSFRRFRRTSNIFVLGGQVRALYQSACKIAALCREQRIDLLHANNDAAALVAWEASRLSKCPFVWHCRDLRPLHGLAGPLSRTAAAVVPISAAVEAHLENEGVRPEKLRRVDNGIDLGRLHGVEQQAAVRAGTRLRLDIPNHCPVLLSVGGYAPWKRHEIFLRTLAEVRRRVPTAMGLLAGSDLVSGNTEYGRSLVKLAIELGLSQGGVLRILDERDDVPDLMAAADLLVSCSDNEPWGRVVAEAGASGLAVVSTATGAKREIIADDATGVLVASGSVEDFTAACVSLLNDPARRAAMGRAARERIATLYDVRRTARQMAELFERIGRRNDAS